MMSFLDNTPTNHGAVPVAASAPAAAHFADHRRIVFGAGMRRAALPAKPPMHLRDSSKVKFGAGI